jgi:hypothetical protein
VRLSRVHLVRLPIVGLLYRTRMIDDCAAFGGMRIGRGNRSARRKPAPVPLRPPQIPHYLTWDRTRAVGSRRLTAWAMARPNYLVSSFHLSGFYKFLCKRHRIFVEKRHLLNRERNESKTCFGTWRQRLLRKGFQGVWRRIVSSDALHISQV